ncbi:outer membrane protein/peptidoglycan-associated (lipo)protein [Terriglobus roseus DSM 18391]|uniref:Outer membrane protein/peptidoglycan-associated (Lipo)protein n=1 Tax=Terriglobus roseus (strain DSM 18391 / NRRL B-41598 / KBS 63) TaxID=926566 RepID=I3ZIP7_TERRK|nr:OmpA family protein [Terriglobus roseus]AFL89115.1 outer membrane protein/peptidoglycan-associated (lipo)protein [Terriglobus roseus DSM 18391]
MNYKFQVSAGLALAAGIVLPAASFAQIQDKDKKDYPKSELFIGYSHLRAAPTLADGNRLVMLNGGNASIAYNVNRYFGLVTDFAGYRDSELRLSGPGAVPTRIVDSSGSVYTFLFGPRFSYRAHERFTPFAQVLAGGAYATAVTLKNCTTACTAIPEQGTFAMTAGGGLDVKLSKHVALRAVQAEYLMTRFADTTTGNRRMQNDLRLSAGLVFRFGGHAAVAMANRAPVSVCSVDKPVIYAGGSSIVSVHAKALDADNDPLRYAWMAGDGQVQGTGSDVQWDLAGGAVGSHTINVKVDDGRGGSSDCSAEVMIAMAPNHSPMLTCSIAEHVLEAGQTAHLMANATDADGDPLQYTWTTNAGMLRGDGPAVTLQTSPAGNAGYSVGVRVTDGRGGTSDCSVNFSAQRSPEFVKLEERLSLRSVYFPTAEPTVAKPERGLLPSQHKTLLSLAADFSQYLKTEPQAKLILEGHADPRGSAEYNQKLSELRVGLTKQYLVEHGVGAESIEVKARGDQQNLSDAQVREAITRTPELSEDARNRLLQNMKTVILASNRRVDVTLSTTNQHSVRQYPFNASDSMTLLSEQRPGQRKMLRKARR